MTKMQTRGRIIFSASIAGSLLVACSGAGGPETGADGTSEAVGSADEALVSGAATNERPAVGKYAGFCAATLVDSRYVISAAANCMQSGTGPRSATFEMRDTNGTPLPTASIDYAYSISTGVGTQDIAIGRLTQPVSNVTPVTLATRAPGSQEAVTAFGLNANSLTKDYVTYGYTSYTTFASAWGNWDLGGARVLGTLTGGGAMWGLNSMWSQNNSGDIIAEVWRHGPSLLRGVKAFGNSTNAVTSVNGNYLAAGAKMVSGDFDKDGMTDFAFVGGNLTSIPMFYGNYDGSFTLFDGFGGTDFAGWARSARSIVVGDFEGWGADAIALVGGSGWTTIPIAFGMGRGKFVIRNNQVANIPGWAQQPGVYAVAGDFSGDTRADIALLGGSGWTTIPVALGTGNGTFAATTNASVPNFPGWSCTSGVKAVVADFDKDGKADIALTGVNGWTTLPVAFGPGDPGNFAVSNQQVPEFAAWTGAGNAKVVAGDFDNDGDGDLAAVVDDKTIKFALSQAPTYGIPRGLFQSANFPMQSFPGTALSSTFMLPRRFNGRTGLSAVSYGQNGVYSALLAP